MQWSVCLGLLAVVTGLGRLNLLDLQDMQLTSDWFNTCQVMNKK